MKTKPGLSDRASEIIGRRATTATLHPREPLTSSHCEARATAPTHAPPAFPSSYLHGSMHSAPAAQAARDEELLRGECATAFEHYKAGNLTQATALLQKLLARHPAHPLLHFSHMQLAHMLLLEPRHTAGIMQHYAESHVRADASLDINACPHSLLLRLLYAQVCYDVPVNIDLLDDVLDALRQHASGFSAGD